MVKYISANPRGNIDLIFHSLADPTRRKILERLTQGNLTVSQIATPYKMSLPAISKHLRVLEKSGLIKKNKEGREIRVRLEYKAFKTASGYVDFYTKFWNKKFEKLENYLKGGEK